MGFRSVEDVARLKLEQLLRSDDVLKINFNTPELDWNFEWGNLLTVGGYALSGFFIGSAFFPGIGSIIGPILGTLLGGAMLALDYFVAKKGGRILKMQNKIQEKIDEVRKSIDDSLGKESEKNFAFLRKNVDESFLNRVQKIDESLRVPLDIINHQISIMVNIKNQLERKSYGTI